MRSKIRRLSPRTLVITGASRGIGAALATSYAEVGRSLLLIARDAQKLDAVAATCRARGAEVETAMVDVRDPAAMMDCIRRFDDRHPVDLVIANAGVSSSIGADGSPEPPALAQTTFDVNLGGAINSISPLIEPMCQRGGGQIAVICSLAALYPFPNTPSYSASKVALATWARAVGLAHSDDGIRVTVIYPGFVETDMSARVIGPRPMIEEATKAAARIRRALRRGRNTIAFPFRLRLYIACLRMVPYDLAKFCLKPSAYTVRRKDQP
ncbi:MAG: SDR family NAD(P)-dependent oxidoreductase [Alphaproteobacteria bacterium]